MAASDPGNKTYWLRGEPFVWVTASALSAVTLFAVSFVIIILANALGFFWPGEVTQLKLQDGGERLGRIVELEQTEEQQRLRIHIGNRDLYGEDFAWIDEADIVGRVHPPEVIVLERLEYGNFFGFLSEISWEEFNQLSAEVEEQRRSLDHLFESMESMNGESERLRGQLARERYRQQKAGVAKPYVPELETRIDALNAEFEEKQLRLLAGEEALLKHTVALRDVSGRQIDLPVAEIVRAWQPNVMSVGQKVAFYASKVIEMLAEEPRESNTEGGLFPAIFGTVMMVLIMSLFSVPFGVIAAIYMSEYARSGRALRLVRISVNNLAGVPSIVYGVFGLGFFIYTMGSAIDQVFFPHLLPTPTFGTGGILWASLTLALLTVPVVIVSTEEALSAIPQEVREGSLGLGATKFQTLVRILLPMSTPGILTGLILAMARAAGEVAPLMLTGAVKLAPELAFDGQFPFMHFDRKFMHLGFHIYDLGFQSPNVEAVLPMVYVTTTLLLGIVIVLSAVAIILRNRLSKKYTTGVF